MEKKKNRGKIFLCRTSVKILLHRRLASLGNDANIKRRGRKDANMHIYLKLSGGLMRLASGHTLIKLHITAVPTCRIYSEE